MVIKVQKTTIWLRAIIVSTLLLVAFGLTGCGWNEPVHGVEGRAAEVVMAAVGAQASGAGAVVDEADGMAEETAVAQEPIDECLACHIDKEMLIATAAPEEEVISENEGEG